MKLVIFGLSISSSWGNGHATLWRALCRGLSRRGHRVIFFEKDSPWYAGARDGTQFPGCDLRLYPNWEEVRSEAARELGDADAGIVTSYCPDGPAASDLVLDSRARLRVFYDLDTPVTLSRMLSGEAVEYLPPYGLGPFDLVLSYTGGDALRLLGDMLGARRAAPLYGSVDPDTHRPGSPDPAFAGDLSYIGTYAADRQDAVERYLIEPARQRPYMRFIIAGAQYPHEFPWTDNIHFVRHLPPADHPSFFSSARLTLNVTRQAMAEFGYCPSGRLFEAAACGAPILSDSWDGIESFYTPGEEILLCSSTEEALAALDRSDDDLRRIASRARERTLAEHTAEHRANELESILQQTACGREELCGA